MISISILAFLFLWIPQATGPIFEVASIKRNLERGPASGGVCHGVDSLSNGPGIARTPLGHCVFTRDFGYHLVTYAYRLENGPLPRNVMIQGVPDWLRSDIYDVDAKAEDPSKATEEQLIQMLRNMLAERFKLKFHFESKDVEGFALVEGKNGAKLEVSKTDEKRSVTVIPGKTAGPVTGKNPATFREVRAKKSTLYDLAILLSGNVSGPVIDNTGLKQSYNFDLSWDNENGPSLFTAIQEQLGLRLVPQKSPVQFLVIDSAERPNVN